MIEFFSRMMEHLGIKSKWENTDWWLPIEHVIGKVNTCKGTQDKSYMLQAVWVHNVLEAYLRENIESINSKADFDRCVRQFAEGAVDYINKQ